MAFTYLILNICFILFALIIVGFRFKLPIKSWGISILVLWVLTAIFDTILVHFGIVAYTESHILGTQVGEAPIEDFFYPLLSSLLIPILWIRLGHKK